MSWFVFSADAINSGIFQICLSVCVFSVPNMRILFAFSSLGSSDFVDFSVSIFSTVSYIKVKMVSNFLGYMNFSP